MQLLCLSHLDLFLAQIFVVRSVLQLRQQSDQVHCSVSTDAYRTPDGLLATPK